MVFDREALKILYMTLRVLLEMEHLSFNTKYKSLTIYPIQRNFVEVTGQIMLFIIADYCMKNPTYMLKKNSSLPSEGFHHQKKKKNFITE